MERRAAIAALIPVDPRRALELSAELPWAIRSRLPGMIAAELERPVSARGEYLVLCPFPVPGRPGPQPALQRTFRTGEETFEAFVYGRRLAQTSAGDLRIHGVAADGLLAIHESAARILEPEEAAARVAMADPGEWRACAFTGEPFPDGRPTVLVEQGERLFGLRSLTVAEDFLNSLAEVEPGFRGATEPPRFQTWSHGTKRLLFMRARFPDDPREPVTEAEAAAVMEVANRYFVESSFNQLSVISTIGPLITLPQPKMYYAVAGPGALMDHARNATRSAGVEPDAFDLDMVRFEPVPGFHWGGLGAVGGRGVWLQGSSLGVICHELGHNLGLSHANLWDTVRPELPEDTRNLPFDPDSLVGLDSVIGPGDDVEYGDPYDMMGGGGSESSHFSGLHTCCLKSFDTGEGWLGRGGEGR